MYTYTVISCVYIYTIMTYNMCIYIRIHDTARNAFLLSATGAKLQVGSGLVALCRHGHPAGAHDPPDPQFQELILNIARNRRLPTSPPQHLQVCIYKLFTALIIIYIYKY